MSWSKMPGWEKMDLLVEFRDPSDIVSELIQYMSDDELSAFADHLKTTLDFDWDDDEDDE